MAIPQSRADFKANCLRRLGAPVIEINVDDDQVDDRVDEALSWYWDYHFDGSEKQYYKHQVTKNNLPQNLSEVLISNGGIGYSNSDIVTISQQPQYTSGQVFNINPITDNNGTIISVPTANLYSNTVYGVYSQMSGYYADPAYSITTSTGSGAILQPLKGGYITLPENIIGVVNMFPVGQALNTNNLFNIRYQIALNDLYTLTSVSMVPYYMAMQHVQFLEMMLVGQQPLRYNRHKNRCYVDMDWSIVNNGDFILLEAYQIVDPNIYTDVWKDRWLLRYAACLIKQNWGSNIKKFAGMQLPGGLSFNGQAIYDEATAERKDLEYEMVNSYSLPVADMIG
jgi:hypothetical protein